VSKSEGVRDGVPELDGVDVGEIVADGVSVRQGDTDEMQPSRRMRISLRATRRSRRA
jgi:hypothetical protein